MGSSQHHIEVGGFRIGNDLPLVLIAGPCVIEGEDFTLKIAEDVAAIAGRFDNRHRYEFNNTYRKQLEEAGLIVSGTLPDDSLVEVIEAPDHPWFVGCQFHPEFLSRPYAAHPLFTAFVGAAKKARA